MHTMGQLPLLEVPRDPGTPSMDRLPKAFSPSRLKEFIQCPQLFYYKSVLGLPTPPSVHAAVGTLAHSALELIFDHPPDQRTEDLAVSFVRPSWRAIIAPVVERSSVPEDSVEAEVRAARKAFRDMVEPGGRQEERALRSADEYRSICEPSSQDEEDMLARAEQMVRNWFSMEDPGNFTPEGRELHVKAPAFGVLFHGYIDRIDTWERSDGARRWAISDYKTGKVPGQGKTYSAATMARIEDEAFFAMKIYALLWREMRGIQVNLLRLVYLSTADREHGVKRLHVTERMLDATKSQLRSLWNSIESAAKRENFPPRPGPLCPYCAFQSICPAQKGDKPVPAATGS